MGLSAARGVAVGFCAVLVSVGVTQNAQQPVAKLRGASGSPWRQKEIHFSDEKPVIGLPVTGLGGPTGKCSNDGTEFFYVADDTGPSKGPELLSVSSAGDVKNLQRKMPVEYTAISVRDFFAADHTLVALLRADRRDDRGDALPRETRYFLSTSDHDGDSAELVSLDLKFKPLKVALFGSGDYLVLGWDEANLLPVLVTLKEDGTIRRFVDLDRKPTMPYRSFGSMKEAEAAPESRADLATLQRAAFVPCRSEVLVTYPGTARFVLVLSGGGGDRAIPIQLPSGFVLHDVLVSGGPRYPLVMRVEQKRELSADAKSGPPLMLRMFEMNSNNGSLLQEFYFDKPSIADVECAPDNRLTAIFVDTQANALRPGAEAAEKSAASPEDATQLVIATARH
jgi:hypothetical protein